MDEFGPKGLSPQKFADAAAHLLAELNAIHRFREGNGRSQLSFLILLAERAGHPFDLAKVDHRGHHEGGDCQLQWRGEAVG